MKLAKEFLKFVSKEVTLRPRDEKINHSRWQSCAVGLFANHVGCKMPLWKVLDTLESQLPTTMEDLDNAKLEGLCETWEQLRLSIEHEIFLIEMSLKKDEELSYDNTTRSV